MKTRTDGNGFLCKSCALARHARSVVLAIPPDFGMTPGERGELRKIELDKVVQIPAGSVLYTPEGKSIKIIQKK